MMPGMDGIEVCKRLKANPKTAHIPVVMVTTLSDTEDRVRAFEAGADDFLTKPVNDVALFARVRSLVRGKMMLDELRLRALTGEPLGVIETDGEGAEIDASADRILVVADEGHRTDFIRWTLEPEHQVTAECNGDEALRLNAKGQFDLAVVSLDLRDYDGRRLCSQLRSTEETRHLPIF